MEITPTALWMGRWLGWLLNGAMEKSGVHYCVTCDTERAIK